MTTKFCKSCENEKPLSSFSKAKDAKDGLNYLCKTCNATKARLWYSNNKDKARKRIKEYHCKHPEAHRRRWLKNAYGITIDDYNEMFENQDGCCAICDIHQKDLKRKLFVDHCHKTGKVRGLLCYICNARLGTLEDEDFVSKVERYLKYE